MDGGNGFGHADNEDGSRDKVMSEVLGFRCGSGWSVFGGSRAAQRALLCLDNIAPSFSGSNGTRTGDRWSRCQLLISWLINYSMRFGCGFEINSLQDK